MLKGAQVVLLKSGSKKQGGLEKYARRIAAGFVEKGAKVTYLCTGNISNPLPGVQFHSFPIKSHLSFIKLNQFDSSAQNWLKKNSADLIFGLDRNRQQTHIRAGNGVHAAYLKSRLFAEGKCKYYLSKINPLHQTILSIESQAYCNPILRKIFTNSKMVQKELLHYYPINPAKIQVIHNGVEWKEMEPDFCSWEEKREELLKKHKLDPHLFHILFIGHGFLRKGLDVLLNALKVWKFQDFHLSVVGGDKKLDAYIEKVKKLKMEKKIRFFSSQPHTIPFYQSADALVIPSFYDPFANVTIEALAMGLFVVSSKTNGGHEILTPQNGAIIEDLLDPDSILSALNQALQHKKTKESANRIRERVSHFDFSLQLNQLISACE